MCSSHARKRLRVLRLQRSWSFICAFGVCLQALLSCCRGCSSACSACREYWPDLAEAWHGLFKCHPAQTLAVSGADHVLLC